jgi:hypothetical protein
MVSSAGTLFLCKSVKKPNHTTAHGAHWFPAQMAVKFCVPFEPCRSLADLTRGWRAEIFHMMRSMIFVFAIVAVSIIASSTMLRSRSLSIESYAAAMPSLQELHAMAGVNKLPVQQMEDLSVIFPTETRQ